MTMNFQKRKLGFLRRNLFLPVNRDKANILCKKKIEKIYENQFAAHITRQKWNLFIEIVSECFELWMDRMETDFNM